MARDLDDDLRDAALGCVLRLQEEGGGLVRSADLRSFEFRGRQVPLIEQRGIRRVKGFDAALTIRTAYVRPGQSPPYQDTIGTDGYLRYKWRGHDGSSADNVGLRNAMTQRKMLIWFQGVGPGTYLAICPVWIAAEEPAFEQVVVALDTVSLDDWSPETFSHPEDEALRRVYVEDLVRRRVHQPLFRQRVLLAYRSQCSLCRLRVLSLLEAAHIKPDAEGGQPIVSNGISMCAIHHRAFDRNVLGITPKRRIEVRPDILREHDGPTLEHALQGLHGREIIVPRAPLARPSTDLLEERFERFLEAS